MMKKGTRRKINTKQKTETGEMTQHDGRRKHKKNKVKSGKKHQKEQEK